MSRRVFGLVPIVPFVFGPIALRGAVGPAGDALAQTLVAIAPPVAVASPPDDVVEVGSFRPWRVDEPVEPPRRPSGVVAARRPITTPIRAEPARETPPSPPAADRPKGTIFVPAGVVEQAIAKRDVGATNAVASDKTPLGARIHGVSRYRTGLRDGDIIVSVGGKRTPTTSALVDAGMRALSANARRLTGRIVRGDELWDVVLELPARP